MAASLRSRIPLNSKHDCRSQHVHNVLRSYYNLLGHKFENLNLEEPTLGEVILHSEWVVISHGNGPDPLFNYGNKKALSLFEVTLNELKKIRSRNSAEITFQSDREVFMQQVRDKGFATGYSGVRISATGKRFEIKNVTVWNVTDEKGDPAGQAACFKDWDYIDLNN